MLQNYAFLALIAVAALATLIFLPVSFLYALPIVVLVLLIGIGWVAWSRNTRTGQEAIERAAEERSKPPTGVS